TPDRSNPSLHDALPIFGQGKDDCILVHLRNRCFFEGRGRQADNNVSTVQGLGQSAHDVFAVGAASQIGLDRIQVIAFTVDGATRIKHDDVIYSSRKQQVGYRDTG